MGRFCETEEIQMGADQKLFLMLQTADDFMRRFTFADETSNKPITPRLKRDELGINVFPTVHAELVNRTPVLSESAKRRQERQVRIVHCFVQHD